jgi:hypothetical protein
MKGAGPFIALFVIIALIIEFIWWILGAIALVVLFYIVRAARNLSTCLRHRSAEFTEQPPRCCRAG